MDLSRLSASELFEQIEASRRALLQYYNSSALQHLSYSFTLGLALVGLLYNRSELLLIFADPPIVGNLVFLCIIDLIVALGFHNIGRTMFYGSSSSDVMKVMPDVERIFSGETIMDQLRNKTTEIVRKRAFVKYFYYTNWSIIGGAFGIGLISVGTAFLLGLVG